VPEPTHQPEQEYTHKLLVYRSLTGLVVLPQVLHQVVPTPEMVDQPQVEQVRQVWVTFDILAASVAQVVL
jgi:hypothetical protein